MLEKLFAPSSVAIVGASSSPEKVGAIILKNIQSSGFTGKVYPVNPKETTISDLTCYPSVSDLPEVVDLTIIAIPAEHVNEVLTQVGEKGMHDVVVLTAGFKEMGGDGLTRDKEMQEIAAKYSINILGPNCMGFVNTTCPINATFAQIHEEKGNFCFLSQSGAIASSLFDYSKKMGIGFSEIFSLGNKANIGENEVLSYLLAQEKHDDAPRPIGIYLESIIDGRKFVDIATQVSKRDPIFMLKPGKTAAAKKAMQSHTGAIAGEDAVLDAALKEAGIIRCDGIEDFFDYLRAFSWGHIPTGNKIAIISNAGGPAVMTSDDVIDDGLEFFAFDTETTAKMNALLPPFASTHNPIDVLGDALSDRFASIGEIVMRTPGVDVVLCILTPQMMTQVKETAEIMSSLQAKYNKPIFCSFIGGEKIDEAEKVFQEKHVVNFAYPERAVKIISNMYRWNVWRQSHNAPVVPAQPLTMDTQKVQGILDRAVQSHQPTLTNTDASELLAASGIQVPATILATSLDEAKVFAATQGWPVVLKLSSPGLLHKAAVGGVITGIHSVDSLAEGWRNLETIMNGLEESVRAGAHIQIQKQVENGIEIITGIKHDSTFGLVMLFGLGGKFVNFIHDHNLHLLPLSQEEAVDCIKKSQAYTFLGGDSIAPDTISRLAELLLRMSDLAINHSQIDEIEINPVIFSKDQFFAVDGKVVLKLG